MAGTTSERVKYPRLKQILLTQGQVAFVDDGDYEDLMHGPKWYACWRVHTQSYYAHRHTVHQGRRSTELMHRYLLGLAYGDKRQGDHENHNTLDNQRHNLRIATPTQNRRNRKMQCNNTSGFKGVYFDRRPSRQFNPWRAYIKHNGKMIHLGIYATAQEAAVAYNSKAKELYKEFAALNFIKKAEGS